MADISLVHSDTRGSILSRVGHWFWDAMEQVARANSRMRQFEALQALTDAQLAARGLKREDIVRHVFRDVMYL